MKITIARGDGIGPEIMAAVLKILRAAEAPLEYEEIEVGEKLYLTGVSSGIPDSAWETLKRNRVFLKAPITTPQGGGYKSLNVAMRKTLGLYANVRPNASYAPFVPSLHAKMDLVIVRENEEDLYAGIEHRQTNEVYQCLKLMSRPGTEKIVRYAFEYARVNGRKKVSCFSKDNIMKMTDGMFHRVFDEVGAEYPEIAKDHWIIDIGAARVAKAPELFDVIVTSNLYGDILSDIAAEVSGSVGCAGSANIGDTVAMFEAIHGSAPLIAGKGIANPSGLLQGATQMLVYLGLPAVATRVQNAWLRTLEDGVHTADIFQAGKSKTLATTTEFADAVIARLGQRPDTLPAVDYEAASLAGPSKLGRIEIKLSPPAREEKTLVGVDVFIDANDRHAEHLAALAGKAAVTAGVELGLISNRGLKVWPDGSPDAFCSDHWRARFLAPGATEAKPEKFPVTLSKLIAAVEGAGLAVIKIENLYLFGEGPTVSRGYSLTQ